MQFAHRSLPHRFRPEAEVTGADVLSNIPRHLGPPVVPCHDLAKRLSHYLYFFSFLFLFLYLGLTTQKEVRESVTSHSHIVMVT